MQFKKKILILENFTHYRNCAETYKLLKDEFNVSVLVPNKSYKYLKFFNIRNLDTYFFSNYLIYIYLLFVSWKYNFIIISNPPEYPDKIRKFRNFISFGINYLTFLIFCLFFKNKIILQIRNIKSFFPEINNNNFLSKLRYVYIILIKRFTFETLTISKEFKKLVISNKLKNKIYTHIYINHHYENEKFIKVKSKIGILGTVDYKRKNYKVLFDSLLKLNDKKIEIVFLGKIINFDKSKYKNLNIKTFSGFIPFTKFLKIGKTCKFLVSNLINKKIYGKFKSSGTFGDAIFLNKPLIVPEFSDPSKEFKDFSFYYKDVKSLTNIILSSLRKKKIKYNFINFKKKKNLVRLINDLKL
jgi:hypothetical protein